MGLAQFKGPLLHVKVHQEAIWIQPLWMRECLIFADEIDSIREEKFLFLSYTRVEHHSPDLRSPVKIYTTRNTSQVDQAIFNLTSDYELPGGIA